MKENTKILVVDDMNIAREAIRTTLERIGYSKIQEAGDGFEVRNLARESKPDLIIMDTEMPASIGYNICRLLKKEPYGENIAVIGTSGDDCRALWLEAGADDFFDKKEFAFDTPQEHIDNLDARIQGILEKYR